MVALPDRNTDEGAEARVLLAECRSPAHPQYNNADAMLCMQLMDRVLWNRMDDPARFGARGAANLRDIIKARGQFAGFENYPNYATSIRDRIQQILNIANSSHDSRSVAFTAHVNVALNVAAAASIQDPSAGKLASWRTAGSGSPGPGFQLYATRLGNDFYYIP